MGELRPQQMLRTPSWISGGRFAAKRRKSKGKGKGKEGRDCPPPQTSCA